MKIIVSIAALSVIALLALDSFGMMPEEAEPETVETEAETEAEPVEVEVEEEAELQSSISVEIVEEKVS